MDKLNDSSARKLRLVVVLGMHRSGTSAITKSLELMGVGLGANLHPVGFDNPRGFWEDRECIDINNEILSSLGSAYDRLDLAWDELSTDAKVSELRARAIQVISRKLVESDGIWGFKDPRTCRLLGFWKDVFWAVNCEVSFVIAVRNPASVAASLWERNGIPAEKAYFLWLQHVLPPLDFVQTAKHVVVDYDEFLGNPYAQMMRISMKLGLPLPDRQSSMVRDFEDGFLSTELRHSRFTEASLGLDSRAPGTVSAAFNLLQRLATDRDSLANSCVQGELVELNARLKDASPAFDYINTLEESRQALHQALADRDGQIASLNQAVAERDGQIVSLNQAVAERDGQIVSLNQVVDETTARIVALTSEITAIKSSISWKINVTVRLLARPLIAPVQTWRLIRHSVRLGGGCWATAVLLVKVLQRQGFEGVIRRLRNSHALMGDESPLMHSPSNCAEVIVSKNEYVPLLQATPLENKPVKLICFYLPQFHSIPENDAWWGKGFTEWSNVQPAQAQFKGHYQPHIPDELGYYNLLDPNVQRRQVELAKLYGIEGFCFYFYWFGGKRLLETPIQNYLNNSSLDLPFCLCWANENWSRRWDGLDGEILIGQQYSNDDDLAFIQHVARYMSDPRYIRIDGKPLLLVYRPNMLPSARETSLRWRNWCRVNGIGEIYLAYTQSFKTVDPAIYGFDAAVEFPPNNSQPPDITGSVKATAPDFGSTIYDWRTFVERSEHYKQPGYTLFRSVCPAWDNTARLKNRGTVFLNNTPALFQHWLENAIRDTQRNHVKPDERLIFVNAWNEWAEGAYLEPDTRYGYAYLQATRNALSGETFIPGQRKKIVLVTHDAHPHGAQLLAVNLAKTFSQGLSFLVDLVCLGDGPLKTEYAKWATLHDLTGFDARGPKAVALAKELYDNGHRFALVNTTVSGYFLETLATQGFECVALVHELRGVLDQLDLHGEAATIATHAKKIVFPAIEVAQSFSDIAPVVPDKVVIRPQGLYKRRSGLADRAADRRRLRQKLGLPDNSQIILGVGYADHRKGIDLFVEAGLNLAERAPLARWVWIGNWEQNMQRAVEKRLGQFPTLRDRFLFLGLQSDTDVFYGGADVFVLTSREDPFPSVVLEALDAGLPVIGFEGAGGFVSLLNEGCGRLVAKEDAEAFAEAVRTMIEMPHERELMSLRGAELINERFSFRHYLFDLLDLLGIKMERVSVIVPNYNYAQYLPERLTSIIKQDYPVYEIIFLDDCSTDDSVSVARKILESTGIDYRIVINDENSGSVFRQWKKGVELASGTHVWIAEADDSCGAGFLTEVIEGFRTPGVVLSYCESQQMAEDGKILSKDYLDYVSDIDKNQWLTSYIKNGLEEIKKSFSVKNTIPNVSGVLFEIATIREVLNDNIELICSYRMAGDWLVYVLTLERGKIAFFSTPLNMHRRHNRGVTIGNSNGLQIEEIRRMQERVAERHGISAEDKSAARTYIKTLSKQFGFVINCSLAKAAERYASEVRTRPDIHHDDFIFSFLINNQSFDCRDSAVKYYFYDGLKSARILSDILNDLHLVSGRPLTMLEFASGYGCVTRHLKSELPNVRSVACDIHTQAVDFIRARLGAEAILSCTYPAEFSDGKRYDVVFALSFFSHMPRSTWSGWLVALYNAVAPGGALIFTTQGRHSAKYFGEPELDATGFWFRADSEQKDLDVATYGQTIVSEAFVQREIEEQLGRPVDIVREGFWWEHQDCYVVRKPG